MIWQLGKARPHNVSKVFGQIIIDLTSARYYWSGRTGSYLQMNRLSLRNNRLMLETAGKLPVVLEEFIEYTPL